VNTLTATLVTTALLTAAPAIALKGVVTDEKGRPIADASIEHLDSHSQWRTNAQDAFEIARETVDEIHVEADGINHKVIHLSLIHISEPTRPY